MEIWRSIEGYEGFYEVSNMGRVRSVDRVVGNRKYAGKILSLRTAKSGYRNITLSKKGVERTFRVHRLVAQAFIPNPDNLPEVNHKNPIRLGGTDEATNLNWCTRMENLNEELAKIARKEVHCTPVVVFTLEGERVGEYKSIKECEKELSISNVSLVIRGIRRQSGGYIIKKKEMD